MQFYLTHVLYIVHSLNMLKDEALTSGNLYNFIDLDIVIFLLRLENLQSTSFFGFRDLCQYLQNTHRYEVHVRRNVQYKLVVDISIFEGKKQLVIEWV